MEVDRTVVHGPGRQPHLPRRVVTDDQPARGSAFDRHHRHLGLCASRTGEQLPGEVRVVRIGEGHAVHLHDPVAAPQARPVGRGVRHRVEHLREDEGPAGRAESVYLELEPEGARARHRAHGRLHGEDIGVGRPDGTERLHRAVVRLARRQEAKARGGVAPGHRPLEQGAEKLLVAERIVGRRGDLPVPEIVHLHHLVDPAVQFAVRRSGTVSPAGDLLLAATRGQNARRDQRQQAAVPHFFHSDFMDRNRIKAVRTLPGLPQLRPRKGRRHRRKPGENPDRS